MIGEFVERRGGGLLMLGGPRSFAEGGYAGTPVADALPVTSSGRRATLDAAAGRAAARASRRAPAKAHGVTQIAATEAASTARWNDMPVADERQRDPRGQAWRNGAAQRHRRAAPRSGRARVAALRPRQDARVSGPGLVALADGREDERSRTRRTRTTGVSCCAGSSTACPIAVDVAHADRSRRAGRTGHARRRRRRSARSSRSTMRASWRRSPDRRARPIDVPMQWTGERNGAVPRDVPAPRRRACMSAQVEATRAGKSLGTGDDRRCAPRRATPSTSTRRCTRATAADRRGNRRPLLHARDDRRHAGRPPLHRTRRDDGRGARALAHADRADAASSA